MKIIQEFKEFAVKGNAFELAVGVIIGAAFGKIVSSLVSDIIMPLLGLFIGGVNFTTLHVVLREPHIESQNIIKDAIILNYGNFIQVCFDFFIIAFSIFLVIKFMNSFKRKEAQKETATPEPTNEERLLTEIRDLLKKK